MENTKCLDIVVHELCKLFFVLLLLFQMMTLNQGQFENVILILGKKDGIVHSANTVD